MSGPPPVLRLGSSVLLSGPALTQSLRLVMGGVREHRRDGIASPPLVADLRAELEAAIAQSAADIADAADVRETADVPRSEHGFALVDSKEAARMLGIGCRQARRLLARIGGRRTSKGWRVERALLEAHIQTERLPRA